MFAPEAVQIRIYEVVPMVRIDEMQRLFDAYQAICESSIASLHLTRPMISDRAYSGMSE